MDYDTEGACTYLTDDDPEESCLDGDAGTTPMVRPVMMGHEQPGRLLLKPAANPHYTVRSGYTSRTPMELTACNGNPPVLKLLIGAQIKVRRPDISYQVQQCLHSAARHDDSTSVQILLDTGARPGKSRLNDRDQREPCAMRENFEVIQLLLQNEYMPTSQVGFPIFTKLLMRRNLTDI